MIQCCVAAGTAGWRAPEMIQCGVDELESLDTLSTSDDTMSSLATTIDGFSSGTSTTCHCLTKSVDIFALGCLFFYILTMGGHPYGKRSDREDNIIKEIKDISLISFNEEAHDLITHLLHRQPSERPDIETCLLHPFFWDSTKRLAFLGEVSDRCEIMSRPGCKDPMDMVLIRLERDAKSIIETDWHQTLDESADRILMKNLRQSRGYRGNSVRDLLRVLRNKKNHYRDLPDDLKAQLGPMPEGFLEYFTSRYPRLLVYVHEVVKDTGLYNEPIFTTYYELPET
jgi:serine/threonine-protein kinase/endoribonuclease IRE1